MEANWIPTAGKDFWLIVRFYGPDKPLFDGTWTLADVERVPLAVAKELPYRGCRPSGVSLDRPRPDPRIRLDALDRPRASRP